MIPFYENVKYPGVNLTTIYLQAYNYTLFRQSSENVNLEIQ